MGTVAVAGSARVDLTGVSATGIVGNVLIWSLIDESQTPNWQAINDSQGSTWTSVDDAQTPNWTDIPQAA